MRIDVLTLFPQIFPGYLGQSILHKALEKDLVTIQVHDLRNWSTDRHHKVDDRPFGGGPGMILMVEPVRNPGADSGAPVEPLLDVDHVDLDPAQHLSGHRVERQPDPVAAAARRGSLALCDVGW